MPSPFWLRTILIRSLVVVLLLVIGGYFLFQARHIILGPQLTLLNDPATLQHDRVVILTGSVRNIARLTLNGRPIFTDRDGYFEEPLVLETGYTIATLQAQDRYGRIVSIERPFVFVPASPITKSYDRQENS